MAIDYSSYSRQRCCPKKSLQYKLWCKGKIEAAIQIFRTKIDGHSRSAEVYRVGVWTYMHAKDFEKALEMDKLLQKNSKYDVQDYVNSGYINSVMGDQELAINKYQKADYEPQKGSTEV